MLHAFVLDICADMSVFINVNKLPIKVFDIDAANTHAYMAQVSPWLYDLSTTNCTSLAEASYFSMAYTA